jgi:hypothetical protein
MEYKYKSLIEFKIDYPNEYKILYRKDLLGKLCEDMGWVYRDIKKPNYWTKERCIEEALKYKLKTEWKRYSCSSHYAARENGWYDECTKHMKISKFYNNVKTSVKNVKLTTLKKINKDVKPKGYWTKERCIEDASKYSFFNDWKKNSSGPYSKAIQNGWFGECTKHMVRQVKPNGYWTKERCIEEALKFNVKKHWEKNSCSSHHAAKQNGWFDECTKHMKK